MVQPGVCLRGEPHLGAVAGEASSSSRERPPVRSQAEDRTTAKMGSVGGGLQAKSELRIILENLSEAH